jgi:hypothetical protein
MYYVMLDTEAELMAPHPTKKSHTSAYLFSEGKLLIWEKIMV